MAQFRLTLFGGLSVVLPSGAPVEIPGRKAQALLAYLAVRPGQAHPRDKLAALLWGDASNERARHSLRQVLVALRHALPDTPPTLIEAGDAIALRPDGVDVDVAAFERLAAEGTPAALERAAALYTGHLLEGIAVTEAAFEEWLLVERERLREVALEALARLLAHQSRAGTVEAAIQTAVRLLGLDPGQEAVHRALMRLYARQGRRGAALTQYQICVGHLQREFGVEPEPDTKQLYHEILQSRARRASTDAAGAAPAPVETPAAETPLIGREVEFARLRRLREAAWQGRCQLVFMTGEGGIGKTRLVAELVSEALQHGGLVVSGRAYESIQILPFGPWVDALRAARALAELDRTGGLAPSSRAELGRLFSELRTPGPPVVPAAEDHVRLFEALTQVLVSLAAQQPLLVVLEDLHWADETSLRLLSFACRRLSRSPVLVVATARAEELASASALHRAFAELEREQPLVRMSVPRLTRTETATLVEALARAGTGAATLAALGERIWVVSEGNPFTVVETMRALGERDAAATSGELPFPERVRETIASRLDRLGDRARQILAVATVIGREFDFGLVQRAAGLGPAEAAEGVEEMVGRRILHVVGERLDFTHDRIRAIAHERLLPPRRQLLHTAVGEALEAIYAERLDEIYDRLAFHYARTEQSDKALRYLTRLAEQALRTQAHGEALAALEEATPHVGRLPVAHRDRGRVDLILRKAHSLSFLGRFREILDLLLSELRCVERLGEPAIAGPYFFRLGHTCGYVGDTEQAARHARRALEEAERCGDDGTAGQAHQVLSLQAYYGGRWREGVGHSRQAVAFLSRTDNAHWLGLAYHVLAVNQIPLGEFDAALESEAEVARIGEMLGDRRLQSFAAMYTGWAHATRGDWEAGIEGCRRSLEGAPDPVTTALALARLGHAYLESGDAGNAISVLQRALDHLSRLQYNPLQGMHTIWLGEARLLNGDLEQASADVVRGLELVSHARSAYGTPWAHRALGRIAEARMDLAGAERELSEALSGFAAMEARFEVGRTQLDLAQLAGSRGDGGTAAAHLAAADHLFRMLRTPRYVERCQTVAARHGIVLDG